jgi:hypothetical protein
MAALMKAVSVLFSIGEGRRSFEEHEAGTPPGRVAS